MKTFFALFLAFAAAPAFAASTYVCTDAFPGKPATTFVIDDSGAITLPNESGTGYSGAEVIKPGQTDDCLPHGKKGILIENGTGPGYWVYRVPNTAFQNSATIAVQVSFDADADNRCSYSTLSCVKQ